MAAQKKPVKPADQPDLFGDSFVSAAKERLKQLLENLKKAQEILSQNK
jgi:hypothetical protein